MSNNLWATPRYAYEYWNMRFKFAADMCASPFNRKHNVYFTERQNSLSFDWAEKIWELNPDANYIWCNPPYSDPRPWVNKAIDASKKGLTTVMLVKTDKSTNWFIDAWDYGVTVYDVIGGRIQFVEPNGVKASSNNFCSSYLIVNGECSNIKAVPIGALKLCHK